MKSIWREGGIIVAVSFLIIGGIALLFQTGIFYGPDPRVFVDRETNTLLQTVEISSVCASSFPITRGQITTCPQYDVRHSTIPNRIAIGIDTKKYVVFYRYTEEDVWHYDISNDPAEVADAISVLKESIGTK